MYRLALVYCFNELNELKDIFQKRKRKKNVEEDERSCWAGARQPKIYMRKRGR